MALQMHQVSASAPFFKPTSSSQGSNYFALSSLSLVQSAPRSSSLEQNCQVQQQQSRQQQSSISKTTSSNYTTSVQQVSSELEQQSSDRLSALHTKLQLEAEKIRKWKNATNVEIKEKDKKLEDAQLTIEGQRKSMTELQLKQEQLTTRLSDEVSNQREIQRKICSTRDMCTALKNHAVQIDDDISKGEKDREGLSHLHQERIVCFEELLAKFELLEQGQNEWRNSQVEILKDERDRRTKLETICQSIEHQLNKSKAEILCLNEQNIGLNESIERLVEEMKGKSNECDILEKEKATLQDNLCRRDSQVSRLENDVDSVQHQLVVTQSLLKEKEGQIIDIQESLEQAKVSQAQQLALLHSSIDTHQSHCKDLEEVNSNLELTLKQTTAQLNENIEDLHRQLDSKAQQLSVVEEESMSLRVSLSSEKDRVAQVENDKQCVMVQLADSQRELEQLGEKLTAKIQQKDNELDRIKTALENVTTQYHSNLSDWKDAESKLESQMSAQEKAKLDLIQKNNVLSDELDRFRSQLKEIEEINIENKEKGDRVMAVLKSNEQAANNQISTLTSQIDTLTAQQCELVRQCSEVEELKNTNCALEESLRSKDSHMEKINRHLTDIETELESKNGEWSSLVNKHKTDIEMSQRESLGIKTALELQVSELQTKHKFTCEELNNLVEKYKNEAEKAHTEHEETKKSFNDQVTDLFTVLEKYRTENQDMMSKKNSEIEMLREQLQESDEAKVSTEAELSSYKDKVELLQNDLDAKNEEMKELLAAVDCLQSKVKATATPCRNTTPGSAFVTSVPSAHVVDEDDSVMYNTPKPRRTTLKKLSSGTFTTPKNKSIPLTDSHIAHVGSTPLTDSHTAPIRSTPQRLYNYHVSSTPRVKNSRAPPPNTPRSSVENKSKKMRRNNGNEESEEISMFKDLYPDSDLNEDEAVFKKPKPRGVTVRKASSTTSVLNSTSSNVKHSPKQTLAHQKGRSRKTTKMTAKKTREDLSWFDSDSVFGFGIDD